MTQAYERDVVAVVLIAYSFRTQNDSAHKTIPVKAADTRLTVTAKSSQSLATITSPSILEKMRAMSESRMSSEFGHDLIEEARAGRLPTMVGRETEFQLLCRSVILLAAHAESVGNRCLIYAFKLDKEQSRTRHK